MLMEAHNLSQVDERYKIHVQAWANHQVQATVKQGNDIKPAYRRFSDFFDYEKAIDNYWGANDKPKRNYDKKLLELMRKANRKGGR